MKIFLLKLFIISAFLAQAQEWKSIEQSALGLAYELPLEWYVGGVLGKRACQCTNGTINTSYRGNINMVVFTSDNVPLDSLKKQKVWGYSFVEAPVIQSLKTEYLNFEQVLSRWNEDSNLQVIRLAAIHEEMQYVLYFWGDAAILQEQLVDLERIIRSIRYVKHKTD